MKNLLVFAALLIAVSCQRQASDRLAPEVSKPSEQQVKLFEKPKDIPKYREGTLLVKYKTEQAAKKKGNIIERVHTKAMEKANDNGFYKVRVDNVEKELAAFKSSTDVEWVSPDWVETILDFQPNDPYFVSGDMYGLPAIKVQQAWNSGNMGKEDVYVVVIDEGCMQWHCDLYGNTWVNQEEMNGVEGVDDDGNGYPDDFYGWNWFNGNNKIYTGNDDHGTHCTGTINGKGNNGIGVIGVAPKVKVINLKFLADFGYDSDAIKAIDYAIDLKQRKGLNIKIMSNSWGGGGFSQGLIEAIDRAKDNDILFVCAAGNSNNNNDAIPSASYPSSYPNENIIAVGASDWTNSKASFSSYGKTSVDLFAPGVNIYSTLPSSTHTPTYGAYSGTSMATPHVSGGLALLASINPELSWSQLKQTLLSTVTPVTGLSPYCVTGGVLNVSTFTGVTSPVVPNATCGTPPVLDVIRPTTITLILDSTVENHNTGYVAIYLRWDKSFDASPIVGYLFQLEPFWSWFLEGDAWISYAFNVPMNRLYTITGRAIDSWGNHGLSSNVIRLDYSGSQPPTDITPPSIPQNVRATEITTSSFRASWNASTDVGSGVKDYKPHWRVKGNPTWTMTFEPTTTIVPNNLLPNTTYEFYVIARDNADNLSDTSNVIEVVTNGVQPPDPTDIIPPVVTITSPQDGFVIPSKGNPNVTINFIATDNVGVTSRQILIDGVVVATNVPTYQWNTKKAAKGSHVITCRASDAAGNTGSKSITVIKN